MQSITSRISPNDASKILLNSQGEPSKDIEKSLQTISARLQKPHPSVTEAALQLLQTNPAETIPYIPDLISAHPDDVTQAVEVLSDLLQSDRALLVPILAAIADLPLSRNHQIQTRATLRYALSIVDDDDVPAVVRAVLRTTPRFNTAARWSANIIRQELRRGIRCDVVPVVAHVITDNLRIRSPVSRALRRCAGIPAPVWVDFLVWTYTLERSFAPDPHAVSDAVTSLRNCVRAGMLAGGIDHILAEIRRAAPALVENANGVRGVVEVVADSLDEGVVDAMNFAMFCHELTISCPDAGPLVVRDLLRNLSSRTLARELAISSLVHCFGRSQLDWDELSRYSTASLLKESSQSSQQQTENVWGQVFVKIRKAFLFGFHVDKMSALKVAMEICKNANEETVKELVVLMEASIDVSFGYEVAVAYLDVLSTAIMRGFISHRIVKNLLLRRIVKQIPNKLLRRIATHDGVETGSISELFIESAKSSELFQELLHVDIGLALEQSPLSLATVISGAVALTARSIIGTDQHDIATYILSTNVLIPVTGLDLYKAVEESTLSLGLLTELVCGPTSTNKQLKSCINDVIPPSLLSLHYEHLVSTMLSFRCGMSAIVGLINLVCQQDSFFRSITESHSANEDNEQRTRTKELQWLLLERLSEFTRMRSALYLAYEILTNWVEGDRDRENDSKEALYSSHQKRRFSSAEQALEGAQRVLDSVQQAMRGLLHKSEVSELRDNFRELEFPQLGQRAVICLLLATPDDFPECKSGEKEQNKRFRDPDLVQMDGILLRELLNNLKARDCSVNNKFVKEMQTTTNRDQVGNVTKKRPRHGYTSIIQENHSSYPETSLDIQEEINIENWFFRASESSTETECTADESVDDPCLLWASSNLNSTFSSNAMSNFTAIHSFTGSSEEHSYTSSSFALHATLGAVLLDRATSYVALARKSRSTPTSELILAEFCAISCAALSSLTLLLRTELVFQRAQRQRKKGPIEETLETYNFEDFLYVIDTNLQSNYQPNSRFKSRSEIDPNDNKNSRILSTLEWICQHAIDSKVSAASLEVFLTISEYVPCHKRAARATAFDSLCTIYEYDMKPYFNNELHITTESEYSAWVHRIRRNFDSSGTFEDNPVQKKESSPWTVIKVRGGRSTISTIQQRLGFYFAGTSLSLALIEGCAWIRELHVWLKKQSDITESHSTKQNVNRLEHVGQIEKETSTEIDSLIETTGLWNLYDILIQLSIQGIRDVKVFDPTSENNMSEIASTVKLYLKRSLQLFLGITHFYMIETTVFTDSNDSETSNFTRSTDSLIMNASITMSNLLFHRMNEILTWYTDTRTEISEISNDLKNEIHIVLQYVIRFLDLSKEFLIHIKTRNNSQPIASPKTSRRPLGILRERQIQRPQWARELARARKMVPRLASSIERVNHLLTRTMKTMRIRSRKYLLSLQTQPPWKDDQLHFGCGLLNDNVNKQTSGEDQHHIPSKLTIAENDEQTEGQVLEEENDADIEHHDAEQKNADDLVQTIHVNFGN